MWTIQAAQIPADYSRTEDPLDIDGMQNLVDELHSEWYREDPDTQRQAIANAYRAAATSPRQDLKWNVINYQNLLHVPATESDPDVFEKEIRAQKAKWDRMGQQSIDLIHQHSQDPEHIAYAPYMTQKYQPGIWKNIRNCANIGPHVHDLRDAAMEDLARGGGGQYYRQVAGEKGIPGYGPKTTAFTWLLLNPKQSKLATLDVHMMRHLKQDRESPVNTADYLRLEEMLDQERQQKGYGDVPLGIYQWAVWDHQRTNGWHQDHSALRPHKPVDWRNVDWAPQRNRRRPKPTESIPGQQTLTRWNLLG